MLYHLSLATLLLLMLPGTALAISTHTTQSDFLDQANTAFDVDTENFDDLSINTMLPQTGLVGDMNITVAVSEEILVANTFDSSSSDQYLKLNNPDGAFKANDTLTVSFSEPIAGLGLYLISEENLNADDLQISTSAGTVGNTNVAQRILNDGNAYYLSFTVDNERDITEVTLTAADSTLDFNYNIDDISVAFFKSDTPVTPPTNPPPASSSGGGGGSLNPINIALLFLMAALLQCFRFRSQ